MCTCVRVAYESVQTLANECFPDVTNPVALESSMSSLRRGLLLVQRALTSIIKELLKNPDAKEPIFKLIAAACSLNASRSQQWFPHAEGQRLLHAIAPEQVEAPQALRTYSHDGLLLNLGTVLLAVRPVHPQPHAVSTRACQAQTRMPRAHAHARTHAHAVSTCACENRRACREHTRM